LLEFSCSPLASSSADGKLVAAQAAHPSGLCLEIPSFLKNFTVADVPDAANKQLALLLDINKHDVQDWKYLADHLGMPFPEIRHIENGAKYPLSPTIEVLKRYSQKNLYDVLNMISEKMGRRDVTIAVIPLLTNMKKSNEMSYESSNSVFAMPVRSSDLNVSDVASVSSSAIRHQNAVNEFLEQSQQSSIFITYADDVSKDKLKQLCKNLRAYSNEFDGIAVITQEDDQPSRHVDNCGWLERTFRNAKHVIVIVSPGYSLCGSNLSAHALSNSTAFIYSMICTELHTNCGKNLRFRPVIFDEQHRQYVPGCLLNTIIYCWPEQHNLMFKFLFGNSLTYSNAKSKMVTM